MRFEPPRTFVEAGSDAASIAPELAFLRLDRQDGEAVLRRATKVARDLDVCPAQALMSTGEIGAAAYYRALARHLGLPFVADGPVLAPVTDIAAAHRAECVALAASGGSRWLLAPTGAALRLLLRARRIGVPMPDIAIVSPFHLATLIEWRAQEALERSARDSLPDAAPRLSARHVLSRVGAPVVLGLALCGLLYAAAPRLVDDVVCLLFFAATCFRLLVCAAGQPARAAPDLGDAALPVYTVLVPLHREAGMVADLLAALDALDYPRAKLEVLVLVEAEDHGTQAALKASRLPPYLRVVTAPCDRTLRTKPRALNIGLLAARGTLVTVYDAEDRPDPDQLRRAAARFASAPADVACLQARLSIGNGDDGVLAGLFALEYAALFDLYNPGATALGLPLALGGTSNHFRTSVLREIGGWDAWNVTEDADLGLRLARFGFVVESLDSTTMETAPDNLADWVKQRRRWTKGWMQTALVLVGDAPAVARQLGWTKGTALALIVISLIGGPLLLPWLWLVVAWHLAAGMPRPVGFAETLEATLATSLLLLGCAAALGCGVAGMRARGLWRLWAIVPLLLPYQLLISAAAWLGLYDLLRRPYHWHKTPHRALGAGLNRSSPATPPPPRRASRRWRRG